MSYTGYIYKEFSDEELSEFYTNCDDVEYLSQLSLLENQYLIIENNGKPVDKFCYQKGELRRITYPIIDSAYMGKIKPRNIEQSLAIDLLQDTQAKVKLIRGVYGSGKDYLMMNQAIHYINKGTFDKMVFIRPNVTVANVPEIGYLKGTLEDKLDWTLGPLYDKVGGREGVEQLKYQDKLEVAPLLFIRGRSFENSIMYVTEGQNMTTEIVKLLLSRVGEGTELWINSDNHQTDHRVYEKDNGINKMIEKLAGNSLFGYVYLPKTERSDVANLANLLDE